MSGSRWLQMIVFCFGAAMGFHAVAAEPTDSSIPVSENYTLRTWETDDGIPQNSINAIAQTPDGYLWLATRAGLARFDGVRFTCYTPQNMPGLESQNVNAIFVSREGDLWVGLDRGGVARWRGDRFERILPQDPSQLWITSFTEDAEGSIWFGFESPTKIGRWKNGQVKIFSSEDSLTLSGIHNVEVTTARDGRIWYALPNEAGFFDGNRFQSIFPTKGEPLGWLTPARDGGMWRVRIIAGLYAKIFHYRDGKPEDIVTEVPGASVTRLMEDSTGNLWIGTGNKGLFCFHNGTVVNVPISDALVSSLFEDREGNIWVGTATRGINRLRSRRFFLHQTKDGLLYNEIYSLCADKEGRLWLAGKQFSLVRGIDLSNRMFRREPDWPWPSTMALAADGEGTIWLGTGRGLISWKKGVFTKESLTQSLTALLPDQSGDLWVATIHGSLICRRKGQDISIPTDNGLSKARSLIKDGEGHLWVGTEDGKLFRGSLYVPPELPKFEPVPLPGLKPGQNRFIVPDEDGSLWIGVFGNQLYRWKQGRVEQLPAAAGLPADDLRSLVIGVNDEIWIGTGHGLYRAMHQELVAAMEGRHSNLHFDLYGRADGLPQVEFSHGFRNATYRTPDGHVWLATYSGALEILPQPVQKKKASPLPVLIEEMRAGDQFLKRGGDILLPPNPGPVQIRYTLPVMSTPEKVLFRYRLAGLNDEWVNAQNQRMAFFPHVPPGSFRFEVEAAENDNSPWLPSATLLFTVRPAWWESVWFRLGAVLCGGVLLTILVRYIVKRRMQARMRRLEQEHALELERARIARDIHDELGANLTQITLAGRLAKMEPLEAMPGHVDEITAIARGTVDSLDEIVWAVNPRHDTLASLVEYLGKYAVNFLLASGIECRVDMTQNFPSCELNSNSRHHLFMVVKEVLNNAAKYAGASLVHLKIHLEGKRLRIEVVDNGRGFEVGQEAADSNGLRNMRERMSEIGGECQVKSSPGEGTRVVFSLPMPNIDAKAEK